MIKKSLMLLLLSVFIIVGCKKEEPEYWGDADTEQVDKRRGLGGDFPTLEEDSEFEGIIITRGDLTIKGRLKGSVIADGIVIITKTGYVECDSIVALDVTVEGYVKGRIKAAGVLRVEPTGVVVGTTSQKHLVVHDEAIFHGPSEMSGFKR